MKVVQPSINPTNKLTAAVVATFIVAVVRMIVNNVWPGSVDESFWIATGPIAVFATGWFIKDAANVTVPVVVETPTESPDGPA